LNYIGGWGSSSVANKVVPFTVEASWSMGRWDVLEKNVRHYDAGDITKNFNVGIGNALLCLKRGDLEGFTSLIEKMRNRVASSLTYSTTASLQASHDARLKCQALSDLEMIAYLEEGDDKKSLLTMLDRRLDVLGSRFNDKQYLLGIRRAAMELRRYVPR
jgi:serine/threonine-protein kinase ATR